MYKRIGDDFETVLLLPAVRSAVRDAVAEHEALTVAQGRSELETVLSATFVPVFVQRFIVKVLQRTLFELTQHSFVTSNYQKLSLTLSRAFSNSVTKVLSANRHFIQPNRKQSVCVLKLRVETK